MEAKSLKKIIKEFFSAFAEQNGFIFHKPTIMIRVRFDTLHIINFDLVDERFYCSIAILPLYIPYDSFSLSFGDRLNHFKTKSTRRWGASNDITEIEKDLTQVKDLLLMNAIPWFNEVGHPEGIISFIENDLAMDKIYMVFFAPDLRKMYLGFSYLYTNQIELAEKSLQEVFDPCRNYNRDYLVRQNKKIDPMLDLIKNEPDKIREKLNENINITKHNLKIKI